MLTEYKDTKVLLLMKREGKLDDVAKDGRALIQKRNAQTGLLDPKNQQNSGGKMKEFRLQPKILFGEDSLDYLKTLEYKKVMIVTDEVMTQLKLTDFVTNSLSSTTEIKIFDKIN